MSYQVRVLQNQFSQSSLKRIRGVIDLVNWKQKRQNIIAEIEAVSPSEFMWMVADAPAYHLQYQKQSVVILRIEGMVVIVWRPKFIEYPALVKFPPFTDKQLSKLEISFDQSKTQATPSLRQKTQQYIKSFYGTFFHTNDNFETDLITHLKHFVSKSSAISYWHCAMDDMGKIYVSRFNTSGARMVIRIKGVKQGYDKQIVIFSYKGEKGSILSIVKNKWLQVISFVAMLLIFLAAINCGDEDKEGLCQYRNEVMVGGAAAMMGLMGARIAGRKKDKKKKINPTS